MRPIMAKAISYMKPDIDPNTRLYIPFNEGTGSVAKDYSQYGNHAQLTDVEWSNDGFNGAGKFNGSSAYGNCGAGTSLNITDKLTISAWINVNEFPIDYYAGIVSKKNWQQYRLDIRSTKKIQVNVKTTGGSNDITGLQILNTNKYYYITCTIDTDITTTRIYIDSVIDIEKTDLNAGTIVTTSNDLLIGKDTEGFPTFGKCFDGTLNEIRLYNRILSPAQIAADCYEVVCG